MQEKKVEEEKREEEFLLQAEFQFKSRKFLFLS